MVRDNVKLDIKAKKEYALKESLEVHHIQEEAILTILAALQNFVRAE